MANGRFDLGEWNCITTQCFLFLFCGKQDSSYHWFGTHTDLWLTKKKKALELFVKADTQTHRTNLPKHFLLFLQGENNHMMTHGLICPPVGFPRQRIISIHANKILSGFNRKYVFPFSQYSGFCVRHLSSTPEKMYWYGRYGQYFSPFAPIIH